MHSGTHGNKWSLFTFCSIMSRLELVVFWFLACNCFGNFIKWTHILLFGALYGRSEFCLFICFPFMKEAGRQMRLGKATLYKTTAARIPLWIHPTAQWNSLATLIGFTQHLLLSALIQDLKPIYWERGHWFWGKAAKRDTYWKTDDAPEVWIWSRLQMAAFG